MVHILEPKKEPELNEDGTRKLNPGTVTVVEETNIGLYIWMLPSGEPLSDDDANFLCIPARKGDKKRMDLLRQAAASYGYPDGEPYFYAGSRRVSDDEFYHQIDRMMNGLVPDEYDIPAIMGELEARKSGLGY